MQPQSVNFRPKPDQALGTTTLLTTHDMHMTSCDALVSTLGVTVCILTSIRCHRDVDVNINTATYDYLILGVYQMTSCRISKYFQH